MNIELTILKRGVEITLVTYTKKCIKPAMEKNKHKNHLKMCEKLIAVSTRNDNHKQKRRIVDFIVWSESKKNNNWPEKSAAQPVEIIWDSVMQIFWWYMRYMKLKKSNVYI